MGTTADKQSLPGTRVLVLEDEYLVAMDVADILRAEGATVVGLCPDAEAGLRTLNSTQVDVALVDINLGGEMNFTLPEALAQRGIPFAFATGYDASSIPAALAHVPRLQKPYHSGQLRAVLAGLISQRP